MSPTICTKEQLSIFYGFRDIELRAIEVFLNCQLSRDTYARSQATANVVITNIEELLSFYGFFC